MGTIFTYSITVALTLIFAYGGYRLGKGGSSRLRRSILLGIYALALVVVPTALSIDLTAVTESAEMPADMALPTVTLTTTGSHVSAINMLLKVYIAGICICLLLTAVQLIKVYKLMRGAEKRKVNGQTVYVHSRSNLSPFSFGNIIVACASDIENPEIMAHERAHIARHHSADLCIAQLAATLCWYCPAAWQLRRELKLIHEFQADRAVITTGADSRSYCRLLVERAATLKILAIANNLNHNNLKQRIKMMQTTQSERCGGKWRVLLSLSAMVCAVMLLSVPAVSNTIGQISQSALEARGLDTKAQNNTFVVYGVNIYSDAVKQGNFETVTDFEAKSIEAKDVDGVIFPKIGAIFCTDKKVLARLTPNIRKYVVDGKLVSAKEFSKIPASSLWKIIVSGNTMRVHTRNAIEYQYFDALESAVKAENKQLSRK